MKSIFNKKAFKKHKAITFVKKSLYLFTFLAFLSAGNFFLFKPFQRLKNNKIVYADLAHKVNYSKTTAHKYSNLEIHGTSWLSFRDIPALIKQYVMGSKTLDLGCGAGRSTKFLRDLRLDVEGMDISPEFIAHARRLDKMGTYILIEKNKIPAKNNTYDFVFSSHVLSMIPTKKELNKFFKEVNRVLKKGGIFIAVTGSEQMHSYDKRWVSYKTNFPQNIHVKSGSIVKLLIKDANVILYNYHWTNNDYLEVINNNDFDVVKIHYPLGNENEKYKWLSEKDSSPDVIYILRKK